MVGSQKPYAEEMHKAIAVEKKKGPRTEEKCAKHKTCAKSRPFFEHRWARFLAYLGAFFD